MIRFLIDSGVKVDAQTKKGETALMLLCRWERGDHLLNIIRLFAVDYQSNVNLKNVDGETALLVFCQNGNTSLDSIRLLAVDSINAGLKTKKGDTALTLLCRNFEGRGFLDIVRFLVEDRGLNPNEKNRNGENALHCLFSIFKIFSESLFEVTRFLVDHGADVNAKTSNEGNSVLHYLVAQFNVIHIDECYSIAHLEPIFQILIKKGLDIHTKNDVRENALHLLSRYTTGNVRGPDSIQWHRLFLLDFFRFLLDAGMDLNSKTSSKILRFFNSSKQ